MPTKHPLQWHTLGWVGELHCLESNPKVDLMEERGWVQRAAQTPLFRGAVGFMCLCPEPRCAPGEWRTHPRAWASPDIPLVLPSLLVPCLGLEVSSSCELGLPGYQALDPKVKTLLQAACPGRSSPPPAGSRSDGDALSSLFQDQGQGQRVLRPVPAARGQGAALPHRQGQNGEALHPWREEFRHSLAGTCPPGPL